MCELLGMSFNLPVTPKISFKSFRRRGKKNPHGWGLAFYPDKSAQIFKEPISAMESLLSRFVENYKEMKSKIFIGHVRYASVGTKSYKNTHPFQRELNGKEYVFAHNGTLSNYKNLKLGRFKPLGETDSEYIFCHLLKCFEERGINNWKKDDFEWLETKLREINEYGDFNCIFSDGEHLFCYYDKEGYNGLCFVHRKPPYGKIHLADKDWEIDLAEEKDPRQRGFIIATNRLTDEAWTSFHPGELIVFKNGEIIYSNLRSPSEIQPTPLTPIELKILKILRTSPHRVSLRKIIELSEHSPQEVKISVHSLLCKGYIRQDSRDKVKWHHSTATFYTNPSKRKEIDKLIKTDP